MLMLGQIRVLTELKLLHEQSTIKVVGGIIVWNGTEIDLEQCGRERRPTPTAVPAAGSSSLGNWPTLRLSC